MSDLQQNIVQNKINFVNFRISRVIFTNDKPFRNELPEDMQFGLGYSLHFFEQDKKKFIVDFKISIKSSKEDFNLDINADALFLTENEIDEKFKTGNFAKINAPAIAFPFIRSFIATLSSNSGIPSIIIPPLNFTKLNPDNIETHNIL